MRINKFVFLILGVLLLLPSCSEPPKQDKTIPVDESKLSSDKVMDFSELPAVVVPRSRMLFWKGEWHEIQFPSKEYSVWDYEPMGVNDLIISARVGYEYYLFRWNGESKDLEDLGPLLKLEENQFPSAIAGDGTTLAVLIGEYENKEENQLKGVPKVVLLKENMQKIQVVSLPFDKFYEEYYYGTMDYIKGSITFLRHDSSVIAYVDESGINFDNVKYESNPIGINWCEISPNKKMLAYSLGKTPEGLYVQELETKKENEVIEEGRVTHGWLPDGTLWFYEMDYNNKNIKYRIYDPKINEIVFEKILPQSD